MGVMVVVYAKQFTEKTGGEDDRRQALAQQYEETIKHLYKMSLKHCQIFKN